MLLAYVERSYAHVYVSDRRGRVGYLLKGAVEKHISNIFAKINLPDLDSHNRRVLAVLAWLRLAGLSFLKDKSA